METMLSNKKCSRSVVIFLCSALIVLGIFFPGVRANSDLSVDLNLINQWKEGSLYKTQYSMSIVNNGSTEVSSWTVYLSVPGDSSISQSDGWNGVFKISDGNLLIKPMKYNSNIATGQEITDIGFIITSKAKPSVTVISAQSDNGNNETKEFADPTPAVVPDPNRPAGIADDDYLTTRGNRIVDQDGNRVWLTGINWFGYNTGTNIFDGVWSCNMEEALESIADHGFNLLRIPISSELVLEWKKGIFPEANYNRAINPELNSMNSLEIFDYAINICAKNGMKVMFDIHSAQTDAMGHMTNLWYTDRISVEQYYASTEFLADRYKDDDTLIAFDLKNEPHGKPHEVGAIWNDSEDPNNWKHVAETAGNLVLDINPRLLILIEGIEIYPKDVSKNADYASEDSADYHFCWWGGNLRGVHDYPIDFGSPERNGQIVYSPHDYGPDVYQQPWFSGEFTYESLQEDCWNDNWLFIHDENIAPLLIGEWGGFMREPNLTWMTYLRKLIIEKGIHHTFWCFNANSGDTGGLVGHDFKTWDEEKYAFVKPALWQSEGKFVGLDHQVPLGKSGYGVALSSVKDLTFVPTIVPRITPTETVTVIDPTIASEEIEETKPITDSNSGESRSDYDDSKKNPGVYTGILIGIGISLAAVAVLTGGFFLYQEVRKAKETDDKES